MRLIFEIGEASEPDVDEFIGQVLQSGVIASSDQEGAVTLDVYARVEVEE